MINRRLRNIMHAIVGLAAVVASGIAAADPPARVARMANVNGAVSFSPAGEDEWVSATPNRPLITGDRMWSDNGARAELQIGSLAVRLGSQTSVTILNLDDRVAQFQLEQGTLNVHVRHIDRGQILEVDTPLLAFAIEQPGDYRIDVDSGSASTTIAVRSGQGAAYGEGAAYTIGARQWYRFADSALRDYEYDALPRADAFDAWTRDRDRREDNPVAARYVSPDVIGYADLDEYGTWSVVEGYGNVWIPTSVASDWAPYHYGHWTWIEPWGWTWVDDAPWGFAPFHYGRWAFARERWCWVPGPARVRPVYAPALVAFVGGSDFRVSVGSGGPARGIAWFPLAPGEVYRPSYHVSRNYFTNVNVSNTNVTNTYVTNVYNQPDTATAVYRNRGQRGGVTAMPAAAFVQSRPVAQSSVPLPRDIATVGPVTSVASIAPTRASVIGGGRGVPAGGASAASATPVERPPATTMQRPVVARVAPPPPPPPFSVREGALARDPGRPADPAALVAPRQPTSVAPIAPAVKLVAPGAPATPPPAPTAPRPRPDVPQPAAAGAAPALPSAIPNAPAMTPRSGGTPPVPPPPTAPSPPDTKPARGDAGGQPPKADMAPPPAAIRVPPAGPQPTPSSPQPPQPPKVMERQAMPPQPPPVERPPAAPAPTPTEPGRNPPAPQVPAVANPPAAPLPPPAGMRREPPPQAPADVKPPAPPPPPAEPRRAPPPTQAPADVKPPAAPLPPPAELRRAPPPAQAPADVKPPVATPSAELRRESPPPAAAPRPPAGQPPTVPIAPPVTAPPTPQMLRPPAAAVSPPPPSVRQPEPNPNAERGKVEPPKARPDDKRDEPK